MKSKNKFKFKPIVLLFLLSAFMLQSCEKDEGLLQESSSSVSVEQRKFKTDATNDEIIEQTYNEILKLESSKPFYNTLKNDFGIFRWDHVSISTESESSNFVITMPLTKNDRVNGIFSLSKNRDGVKVKFSSKKDLLEIANDKDRLITINEFNELMSFNSAVLSVTNDTSMMIDFNNLFNEEVASSPCEGGYFMLVCGTSLVNVSDESAMFWVTRKINQARNHYGIGDMFLGGFMDGHSYQEVKDNINDLGAGLTAEQKQNYLDFRKHLSNQGIGNGQDGILGNAISLIGGSQILNASCRMIYVFCWQDPFDFVISVTDGGTPGQNSGGGGYEDPSLNELIDDFVAQLNLCQGYLELNDVDGFGGGSADNYQIPNFEFCENWMNYQTDCAEPNMNTNVTGDPFQLMLSSYGFVSAASSGLFDYLLESGACYPTESLECLSNYILENDSDIPTEIEVSILENNSSCLSIEKELEFYELLEDLVEDSGLDPILLYDFVPSSCVVNGSIDEECVKDNMLIKLNLIEEYGFTEEENEEVRNSFNFLDFNYELPEKLDWSTSSDEEKISQLYWGLSTFNYVNSKFGINKKRSLRSFFTNITGTAMLTINGSIDTALLGEEGRTINKETIVIDDMTLEFNDVWDNDFFYASGFSKDGTDFQYQHYFTPSHTSEWGFAIFLFLMEQANAEMFRNYLLR